jgi:hypothetical protein
MKIVAMRMMKENLSRSIGDEQGGNEMARAWN